MKILITNECDLTNFDCFDFLRSRGATVDPVGCLGAVSTSECKVFEYLTETPSSTHSKEMIDRFLAQCKAFNLSEADKRNIINWRPSSEPDLYAMVDKIAEKLNDQAILKLLELIKEIFPEVETESEQDADANDDE